MKIILKIFFKSLQLGLIYLSQDLFRWFDIYFLILSAFFLSVRFLVFELYGKTTLVDDIFINIKKIPFSELSRELVELGLLSCVI